jgi:hypothetical protein
MADKGGLPQDDGSRSQQFVDLLAAYAAVADDSAAQAEMLRSPLVASYLATGVHVETGGSTTNLNNEAQRLLAAPLAVAHLLTLLLAARSKRTIPEVVRLLRRLVNKEVTSDELDRFLYGDASKGAPGVHEPGKPRTTTPEGASSVARWEK